MPTGKMIMGGKLMGSPANSGTRRHARRIPHPSLPRKAFTQIYRAFAPPTRRDQARSALAIRSATTVSLSSLS
jgi:hypothetical protein